MSELSLIVIPDEDEPNGALLFAEGRIGDRPYRFLVDTGAARSHVIYDEYTATFASTDQNTGSGVFAKHTDDIISVPSLHLGAISKQDFALVRFEDGSPFPFNLIGMDIFKDFCCHFLFDQNRIVLGESSTELDFHTLQTDRVFHPYVDVQLGSNTAKAVWDTGASITVVNLALIEAHPTFFEPVGQSEGTDSTGQQMETPMFVMSGAVIGDQHFTPQRVAGVDLTHVNTGLEIPMDMILGYNIISQVNWLFDFPQQRWAITQR